jgi:hypothetical protein
MEGGLCVKFAETFGRSRCFQLILSLHREDEAIQKHGIVHRQLW